MPLHRLTTPLLTFNVLVFQVSPLILSAWRSSLSILYPFLSTLIRYWVKDMPTWQMITTYLTGWTIIFTRHQREETRKRTMYRVLKFQRQCWALLEDATKAKKVGVLSVLDISTALSTLNKPMINFQQWRSHIILLVQDFRTESSIFPLPKVS